MADGSPQYGSLYCGSDLTNAAERSHLDRSIRDRYVGSANVLGILADSIRHRRQQDEDRQFELVTATGRIRGTSMAASVAYAGNGVNRGWCIDSTISAHNDRNTERYATTEDTVDALREKMATADILFVENLGDNVSADLQTDFVRVPAWIKQRVRVADDWPTQIRSLRRGTRQEVSRVLRKYGYECRLTNETTDIERFYDDYYRPFIRSSYGESAIIVDRDLFIRECRRGILLQLIDRAAVVASALLRPVGRTMAIVWTGMNPAADARRIPGATDALDYFSLLYAHLKGCRWLDFGPSRADLRDGTLRYKSKWGAEINTGHFKQPSIFWTCGRHGDAVRGYLRQHVFISSERQALTALCFLDDVDLTESLPSRVAKLVTPGISAYLVVSLSPIPEPHKADLKHVHPNLRVIETKSIAEAMRIATGVKAPR
ncbi:MAG: hypothetical protein GY949_15750 [Gammaproteobacteria bacterium]|nr:hypothetical protein [Gammaproteobacteria bacterium]